MTGLVVKQSTAASRVIGPILDPDGVEYNAAVISEISISKNGAALAAMGAPATLTLDANGQYRLTWSTTDVDTLGAIQFTCNKTGYQMQIREYQVVPANVYDSIVAGTDFLQTHVVEADAGIVASIQSGLATQLSVDDLPTNAELAAALGTADDAVLAAIATAQAGIDDLPTNAELATALGTADDAVLAAISTVQTEVNKIPRLGETHKHRQIASSAVAKSADVIIEAAP